MDDNLLIMIIYYAKYYYLYYWVCTNVILILFRTTYVVSYICIQVEIYAGFILLYWVRHVI